jgi:3-hydroxybutyryl-CoA dehydratase
LFTTDSAQSLVSSLGEAQKRWWDTWFDFLGGVAVSRGVQSAGLWQSSLDVWQKSVAATLEAQQDAARFFTAKSQEGATTLAAMMEASAALGAREGAAIAVGDRAALSKLITDADIVMFAFLSGDVNPVHLDAAYAERTRFGGRIAHGMLSASLISAVLGTKLPGPGAVYLSQSLRFRAPVMLGDEVTATVTVLDKREGKPIYTLETVCTKADGTVVLEGEAVILYEPA